MPELVHATAVALGGRAALIRGPSGSGKSDLALRCLAMAPSALVPLQAQLVSDDYVALARVGPRLLARAPDSIRGNIEVRGAGILRLDSIAEAEVTLVAELVAADQVSRLPDPAPATDLLGITLPVLALAGFEASAPVKLLLALHAGLGSDRWA